ncbi:MAG: hypothetical protein ABJH06_14195 [Paraglaciecola sp.]|uniref:hypothetical protein n=1 Tax=Paraglaciecola sp. TaxID=1920173 RepID=UPI00326652C4
MKLVYKTFLALLVHIFFLKSAIAANYPDYIFLEEYILPAELKETSALFCSKNETAFTLNDSGNEPVIFEIDSKANIVDKRLLNVKNRDWEAITGDGTHLYIGDIGNNSGNRKTLNVQRILESGAIHKPSTTSFTYLDNPIDENKYLNHDYDAEALVNVNEFLYLFSKSWDTGTLFIYRLNKVNSKQSIKPIAEVNGLPGVITGGDYDFQNKRFVLVGYKVWGIGFFSPFIAILDEQLNLMKFFDLEGYGQVEGICVSPKSEVWFTQESSFFSKNKLVKIKIID